MMTLKPLFSSCFLIVLFSCSSVQTKIILEGKNGDNIHSRGIDYSDNYFVVTGQKGSISKYSDLEKQSIDSITRAEDIRDVKLLNDGSLILMNSGENGIIWIVDSDLSDISQSYYAPGQFLDGMAFWDDKNGVAYGDPIEGKFILLLTNDMGTTWNPINYDNLPYALPNEAGFAASGTGIAALGKEKIVFATGMADTARLFVSEDKGLSWQTLPTPIKSGDTYGIYSMYFWSENEGVVTGGSYKNPDDNEDNCFLTLNGGRDWIKGGAGLGGYISCVHGDEKGNFLVATGRIGTYYSLDRGKNWKTLIKKTFYSVKVSNNKLFFSGKDGEIEVYSYQIRSKN
jgi:photosystem II stability/assembly factor-like uncharacterized protein